MQEEQSEEATYVGITWYAFFEVKLWWFSSHVVSASSSFIICDGEDQPRLGATKPLSTTSMHVAKSMALHDEPKYARDGI